MKVSVMNIVLIIYVDLFKPLGIINVYQRVNCKYLNIFVFVLFLWNIKIISLIS